jgi:hypothetical protein
VLRWSPGWHRLSELPADRRLATAVSTASCGEEASFGSKRSLEQTGVTADSEKMTLLLHERIPLDEELAGSSRYYYVPFEVPVDTEAVVVSYRVHGNSRIDIGLLEPFGRESAASALGGSRLGPTSTAPSGFTFRGWSGSGRSAFVAGRHLSTPGYFCRTLVPGTWWVVLGLASVRDSCEVELRVEAAEPGALSPEKSSPMLENPVLDRSVDAVRSTALREASRELDASRRKAPTIRGVPLKGELHGHRAGFVCGDFHTHSWHSGDAKTPVSDMIAAAEERKLDFMAITDHNTISHWEEIDFFQPLTRVVLIKGQEVTTYKGHFNAFLWGDLAEFRIETDDQLDRALKSRTTESSLVSVNHPKVVGPSWRLEFHEAFEAVEAWGAPWLWFNNDSLLRWEGLWRNGRRIAGIGGSDVHDLYALPVHQYGCPTTWVYIGRDSPTPLDVLEAVRARRVVVTATPDAPFVTIETRPNREGRWRVCVGSKTDPREPIRVRVLGVRGACELRIVGESGGEARAEVSGNGDFVAELRDVSRFGSWFRAELWGAGLYLAGPVGSSTTALLAVTNPVEVDQGS